MRRRCIYDDSIIAKPLFSIQMVASLTLQNDLVVNSFKNHVIQADRLQALQYFNTEMNWLAILGSLAKVPPLFILPSG